MQTRGIASVAFGLMTVMVGSAFPTAAMDPQRSAVPHSPMPLAIEQMPGSSLAFFWGKDDPPSTVEGRWRITEGTTPEGEDYTGTIEMEAIGDRADNLYQLSWNTSEGNYQGLGFYEDGRLLVGSGREDGIYGVALYRIEGDGTLAGKWSLSTAQGEVGTEIATGARSGDVAGEYRTESTDPGQAESSFTGRLTISRLEDTYRLVWRVDEDTYRGIGLRSGDWLIVGWGPGDDFAVAEYEFDGNEATGRTAVSGSVNAGEEVRIVPAKVKAEMPKT